MYKVKPEDEIARFRTKKEAFELDRTQSGLAGALPADRKRGEQLSKRFLKIAKEMDNNNAIEAVRMAHKITDIAHGASAKNSVCQKGCAHCCAVNVSVTAIEAAYIEIKTGIMVNEQPYNKKPDDKTIGYCPFLDKEKAMCSIYQYRPIACRSFFTFDDPKFCVDSSTSHMVMSMNAVTASKQVYGILLECSNNDERDIRAFWQ